MHQIPKLNKHISLFQGAKDQSSTPHAAIANHKSASKSFEYSTDNDNLGRNFLNCFFSLFVLNVCISVYGVWCNVHQLMKTSNCYLFVKRNFEFKFQFEFEFKGFCVRLKGAISLNGVHLVESEA